MNWAPICNHTHYSLLRGFSRPEQLVEKCKENGYKSCGIADYRTVSGVVNHFKACEKHDIKPIIGCDFGNLILLAKNIDGWYNLIHLVSSLDEDGELTQDLLQSTCSERNLICISESEHFLKNVMSEDFYVRSPALMSTFYVDREDSELHRILLCSGLKTTLPKIHKKLKAGEFPEQSGFFDRDDFHLQDKQEITETLLDSCTHKETEEVSEIIEKCEYYDILCKPSLPTFTCPDGQSEENYLKLLSREGWKTLLIKTGKVSDEKNKQTYLDRFSQEFDTIKDANLFGYFLIVRDIIEFVNRMGWLSGPGRGSAAGCLISYLVGITKIDPIEYGLLFERFYNTGRNTGGHISLPDIDIDVPGKKRDEIISYLKDKYGKSNVSQMITFGRLQGRSALKEVFRINEISSFGEMNEITKSIPNEADISDQLQAMDEEDRSIIKWALLNNKDELRDFCFINSRGMLEGEYSEYFEQAIKMEGTFKSQGKHAAGVVISSKNLHDACPMVNQKSGGEKIVGIEMNDLESLGHVKFDILGINLLDKIMKIQDLIEDKPYVS